ncbi:trichohyalin [Drosophila pseudoobscura]|uniref:Trichohyalin n=1 Tax=Drosophila pseudoobscura pseudoobscura TaxID=46245 RepID=A0A6I8UIL5_DROPS|nr:trichohyalin [Drosophila pseudoobscura]
MSDVKMEYDWVDTGVDQPDWTFKPLPQACREKEVAKAGCHTPQAYRFKDIYEGKKKQQLRKCLEAERKQREFHSRPVPNFRQLHERQAAKPAVHRVTQPVTPNVLKNSAPAEMRRRQRLKLELESSRPALKPLPSQSLAEPRLQIKPFNLSAEKRVQKRRLFNAQTSQKQEARRQQQEEQRLRKEREDYQKHRQLTTFRARPSPFSITPR